jgi:selenoprotein W-related protein
VSLFNELMGDKQIESQLETIEVIPSDGGRFEVTVNGDLIYSKLATGRHANPGEVRQLVKDKFG